MQRQFSPSLSEGLTARGGRIDAEEQILSVDFDLPTHARVMLDTKLDRQVREGWPAGWYES